MLLLARKVCLMLFDLGGVTLLLARKVCLMLFDFDGVTLLLAFQMPLQFCNLQRSLRQLRSTVGRFRFGLTQQIGYFADGLFQRHLLFCQFG